ncbi:hypothetical protein BCR33DRAFT_775121 [Rhizoclosmatium globosum]|uniref:Lipid-binding serum glycoprotein N-terminal domain-containing protein n=1 Tax=Rhizoclosmatium globosum TaxID=329046 RepID=A0A1Y2AMX5_9FUNG|nr:hypothetical protein BCR33DRAFT_775121 [Rhizoclosmatium globosum]|eukprot:ORY23901.1 hypothetical protein BCR33DRAFT_775121 [Rhizoclosmatium globosum]
MTVADEFKPKTGVSSIKLALTQDIFNEISLFQITKSNHRITPIAQTFALDLKLEDQHIKQKVLLLGETEFASATNIKIETFAIQDVVMEIQDGFISISIDDVDFKVSTDMTAFGGSLGKVFLKGLVNIRAKLKFGLSGKHCTTDVYDITASLRDFDAEVGTGTAGEAIAQLVETVEYAFKPYIEGALRDSIASALEGGLDSMLVRNWDIIGEVSQVFYKLAVEFVAVPVITKEKGVVYEIGVDSFWKKDGPYVKEEPVVEPKTKEAFKHTEIDLSPQPKGVAAQNEVEQFHIVTIPASVQTPTQAPVEKSVDQPVVTESKAREVFVLPESETVQSIQVDPVPVEPVAVVPVVPVISNNVQTGKPTNLIATKGVPSIIITIQQDILSEMANLIEPITESSVLALKISDQTIKKKVPLLGEKQVAAATNIKVDSFDITKLVLDPEDGYLSAVIDDIKFEASLFVSVLGGKPVLTTIAADVDVKAKLRFGKTGDGKSVKTDVFGEFFSSWDGDSLEPLPFGNHPTTLNNNHKTKKECDVELRNFDAKIDVSLGKHLLDHALDLIENTLRGTLQNQLNQTFETSLEQGMDSALARNWDFVGSVSRVSYVLGVEFLEDPVVSHSEGICFVLGIDAQFTVSEKKVEEAGTTETGKKDADEIVVATAA